MTKKHSDVIDGLKGKTYEERRKELEEARVDESALSRIRQYIEDDIKPFGTMSGARYDMDNKEKVKKQDELKKDVRDLGLGFIELRGGYEEVTKDGTAVVVTDEPSLFIPNIKQKDLVALGVKYDQDTVIYKDASNFVLISTNKRTGTSVGSVMTDFKKKVGRENFTFIIQKLYSELLKGSHRRRKFKFKEVDEEAIGDLDTDKPGYYLFVKERYVPNSSAMYYIKGDPGWHRILTVPAKPVD